MKKPKGFVATAASLLALALPSPAVAKDLWVSPTHLVPAIPPQLDLAWPLTGLGVAVFGFAIPDDMATFGAARMVLLPAANATGTYSVFAEVKREGEVVSVLDIEAQQGVPLSLSADTITEVDVSAVLASALDGASAGNDYVSLLFFAPEALLDVARVLGVRLSYEAVQVGTADISDGAVNSAKVADDSLTSADVLDGPGSGLDADLLDGLDAGAFAAALHVHDDRYYTETELNASGAGGAVHWDNLTSLPAGFADGIDDDTTYTAGPGLKLSGTQLSLASADVSVTPDTNTLTRLDDALTPYSSVTIGADGLGLISYRHPGDGLKVAHCDDLECSSATLTTIDPGDSAGDYSSVTIGPDGLGLISYHDAGEGLKVAHCDDIACTSATVTAVDPAGDVGLWTSVAIGSDGLALISYHDDGAGDLKVVHCGDPSCASGNAISTLDSAGSVGRFSSVAIGVDGLGLISYRDDTNHALKVAHCRTRECNIADPLTVAAGATGESTSLTIGEDGLPLIGFRDEPPGGLRVVHCGNGFCTAGNTITAVDGVLGLGSSVTVRPDGLGLISYRDDANSALKVARCDNLECTSAGLVIVDSTGDVGEFPSVTIGVDGLPLISYFDADSALKVAHCANPFCLPFFRRR